MEIRDTLLILGQQAADLLGYGRLGSIFGDHGWVAWEPASRGEVGKEQVPRRIQVGQVSLMLQQLDYRVTWYLMTDPLSDELTVVCGISGVVNDGVVDRVLDLWGAAQPLLWDNAQLRTAYEEKSAWYEANPMYRQPVKPKTVTKTHLSPRQDAPEKGRLSRPERRR